MLNKKLCREHAAPGIAMSPNNGLLYAGPVRHIVQTAVRIIDRRKTLVLYVHDREQAARGDLRPVWTMFHCKDGYVTLAQNDDGRTSWRTASFDRLSRDWRFVQDCVFYSLKDRERLERYFRDDGHRGLHALIEAQEDMKARRLAKRLRARRADVQKRMACVPALPRGVKPWAYRTALPAYFFYDYRKGRKPVTGVCTGCGHEVTLPGAKHNDLGTCPHCGRSVIMKSRGRRGWIEDRDTCQVIQRTAADEIIIRIFKVNCYYSGDAPVRDFHESARLFIRFDQSRPAYWEEFHYDYGESQWKSGPRPVHYPYGYSYEADIAGHVYCKNLPEALDGTPWQYCPLAAFYGHFGKPMAVIPFLAAHLKHPKLEHLVKVGFCSLAKDLAYDDFRREIPLDQTQNRTHRILGVLAEDVDFLRELDVDFDTLKIYQEYCWEGLKDRKKLLLWQLAHDVRRDIRETLDYMTVHRMTRYLDRQYDRPPDPGTAPRHHRTIQELVGEYRDYLDMCAAEDRDMRSSFVLYPRDLRKAHDEAARRVRVRTDEEIQRGFAGAYAHVGHGLDFEYNGMKIVRPETPDDLVREGHALHHCVGGYVRRVARRECLILFVRRCDDETRPFCTIELRHRRIIQVRGMNNQDPPPEVRDFLDRWTHDVLRAPLSACA